MRNLQANMIEQPLDFPDLIGDWLRVPSPLQPEGKDGKNERQRGYLCCLA